MKSGGKWLGIPVEKLDLLELANKVGTNEARKEQRQKHKADRLRHVIKMKMSKENVVHDAHKRGA